MFSNRFFFVSGKNSVMSKSHFSRTSFWWVRACVTHLWFVHFPKWHFPFTYHPFNVPRMCAVDNFQRLIFGNSQSSENFTRKPKIISLPKNSQESVKHKSTFMFTFTLCNIYTLTTGARPVPAKIGEMEIWCLGISICGMGECRKTAPSRSYHHKPIPRVTVRSVGWGRAHNIRIDGSSNENMLWSIIFQVLWPKCYPSKSDIVNDPRAPYFTSVESFTYIQKFSTGLGGSMYGNYRLINLFLPC